MGGGGQERENQRSEVGGVVWGAAYLYSHLDRSGDDQHTADTERVRTVSEVGVIAGAVTGERRPAALRDSPIPRQRGAAPLQRAVVREPLDAKLVDGGALEPIRGAPEGVVPGEVSSAALPVYAARMP
jgi:hypothetical protein